MSRLVRVLGVLLAFVGVPSLFAEADYERWYVMQMQGKRAGYMHSVQTTDAAKKTVTTATEMVFTIKRGAASVSMTFEGQFVETEAGKPVSMRSSQKMAAVPTVTEFTFGADGVDVATTQGGAKTHDKKPLPEGQWLTPAAAGEYVKKRLEAGATDLTVRSIDPMIGLTPMVTTHKVLERTTIEVLGKTVPAVKWTSRVDLYPTIETVEFADERGIPIRIETQMGGISIVGLLADKELALSQLDPPELLASTLVAPDRPIENPRALGKGVFKLSVPDGGASVFTEVPSGGAQLTEKLEGGALRVTVDAKGPGVPAPESDVKNPEFIGSSAMVDLKDEKIIAMAREATKDIGKDKTEERAEAMRRAVGRHIRKKDLAVGFATASETVRARAGDCSEHGTLLCALLRADGIPARVVSGLIYADEFAGERGVFGYHMWTQALITRDGKPVWIDYDAVLNDHQRFDATHIALATTALADGSAQNAMVSMAPLLGRLRIAVEKAE